MTNEELYKYTRRQFGLLNNTVEDWRPASDMYLEDLVIISEYSGNMYAKIPNGVRFDLKNGDTLIYVKALTKEEKEKIDELMRPRVIKVDEIHPNKVYWMQENDIVNTYPVSFESSSEGIFRSHFGDLYRTDKYGVTWVVWNTKPTREEIRDAEWKAGDDHNGQEV